MREVYRVAIQTAFIAIASRIVGSSYRVAETFNPELKKAGLVMKPDVVIKREAITIGLAWGFSLLTNIVISPMCKRLKVNPNLVTFFTLIVGSVTAEALARLIAYRKMNNSIPTPQTHVAAPMSQETSHASAAHVITPVKPSAVQPVAARIGSPVQFNPYRQPMSIAPRYTMPVYPGIRQ